MKRTNWPVKEFGIRPAGLPDRCFYCNALKEEEHRVGCVIRSKTVLIRATFEYVIDVPEDWDAEQIEAYRNEGSWCSNNAIDELQELEHKGVDFCAGSSFTVLREATPDDEQLFGLSVNELPS